MPGHGNGHTAAAGSPGFLSGFGRTLTALAARAGTAPDQATVWISLLRRRWRVIFSLIGRTADSRRGIQLRQFGARHSSFERLTDRLNPRRDREARQPVIMMRLGSRGEAVAGRPRGP